MAYPSLELSSGNLVVVSPHMDDAELGCGGTVARFADKERVHFIYVGDGSRSPWPILPRLRNTVAGLGAIRTAEARRATEVLGLDPCNVHFLRIDEGQMEEAANMVEERLAELFQRIRPDYLFIPFRFDRHPDHLLVHRAALRAMASEGLKARVLEYFIYFRSRLLPRGDVRLYVQPRYLLRSDIDGQGEVKRGALECHVSQVTRFCAWQKSPVLSAEVLDMFSRGPEIFLDSGKSPPGTGIFAPGCRWVHRAQSVEPVLKGYKDNVLQLLRSLRQQKGGSMFRKSGSEKTDAGKPVRVVLFCRPPDWELGVKRFIALLANDPRIELLGVFCQAADSSRRTRFAEMRRYRRALAVPVFALEMLRGGVRRLAQPRALRQLEEAVAGCRKRIRYVRSLHAPHVLAEIRALRPEIGLVYGAPILKEALFTIPRQGTLGIHHGKLPEYRGVKTTFWAMFNGEKSAGVTIQRINAGLDTGEVVKRGEVPIAGKSLRQVERELEDLGLELYRQAIIEVAQGKAKFARYPQQGTPHRHPTLAQLLHFQVRRLRRVRPSVAMPQ
jgi:LmbE family N-acetylglucosaminyl deacetylase/methionyl-tRNA formyltransferase